MIKKNQKKKLRQTWRRALARERIRTLYIRRVACRSRGTTLERAGRRRLLAECGAAATIFKMFRRRRRLETVRHTAAERPQPAGCGKMHRQKRKKKKSGKISHPGRYRIGRGSPTFFPPVSYIKHFKCPVIDFRSISI